jgi:hypothetical protein
VIQFEADEDAGTAELVLTTHQAMGRSLERALAEIRGMDVVADVGAVLPMVGQGAR